MKRIYYDEAMCMIFMKDAYYSEASVFPLDKILFSLRRLHIGIYFILSLNVRTFYKVLEGMTLVGSSSQSLRRVFHTL